MKVVNIDIYRIGIALVQGCFDYEKIKQRVG
jgi:hypothetical protein